MPQNNEQLPLLDHNASASLHQQLRSYHERQRKRQQHHHLLKATGRVIVGILSALLLTLLLVALPWPAVPHENPLELRSLLEAYEHTMNFSGVVQLSQNGQMKLQQAMGMANVPFKQPMQEHSVFPVGAHVQLLTAVSLYQLQERGIVNLTSSVNELWTQEDWQKFGLETNRTTWCPTLETEFACQSVTFQHLMYMGSGIASHEGDALDTMGDFGLEMGTFLDKPLAFKPGTGYQYVVENYVVLAYMVEKLSQLTMKEYLEQHVFQPLGLIRTTFDPFQQSVDIQDTLVDQYVQFYAHQQPKVSDYEAAGDLDSNNSSSGLDVGAKKHLRYMSTGSCAVYEGHENSLYGLLSTSEDMHKIYTDLFHEQGRRSKLLSMDSIAQIVHTRNPAYLAFGQGIGVEFNKQSREAAAKSNWPTKITFCGSTACTTTCMAMQMPAANTSIIASAFTNEVMLFGGLTEVQMSDRSVHVLTFYDEKTKTA